MVLLKQLKNKNMTQIFKSYIEFLQRENKEVNGVSEQFALDNKNFDSGFKVACSLFRK